MRSVMAMAGVAVAMVLGGCTAEVDEGGDEPPAGTDVGVAEQEIHNGDPASTFQLTRAAYFGYCTGTIIGKRHVLTAAHCLSAPGDDVAFYTAWDDWHWTRNVQSVALRPGVNPMTDDLTDSGGKFADVAIVTLDGDIPSYSTPATMAWLYPSGGDDTGWKVGAGRHDGDPAMAGLLLHVLDMTYSDNDNDGHFLTENEQTNPGDSGGAFFYSSRLLGDLYGDVFEWEIRNKYTSVPFHLNWILGAMGYTWSGEAEYGGLRRIGTTHSTFSGKTKKVCQYACDQTASCVAYNYTSNTAQCTLLSSVTGYVGHAYSTTADK